MNNKNKYTLHIDESGTCGLTDSRSTYFILTGFVMEKSFDREVSGYFNFLKRKYGLGKNRSFHSYELFEKKKSGIYLSDKRAELLATSLSEFIDTIPAKFIIAALNKNKLKKYYKIKNSQLSLLGKDDLGRQVRDIAYDILASKIFFWFTNEFLKKPGSSGAVVAESRLSSDHSLLTAYLHCKDPLGYINNKQQIHKSSILMREKISSVKFENKIGQCSGLELADLISYISNIALNRRTREFKNRGLSRLWKNIRDKAEGCEIQIVDKDGFSDYLPSNRVYKISNYCKSLGKA